VVGYGSFIIMKRARDSAEIVKYRVVLLLILRPELLGLIASLGSSENSVLNVEGLVVEGTGVDGDRLVLASTGFSVVAVNPRGSYLDVGHDVVVDVVVMLLFWSSYTAPPMTVTDVPYEEQSHRALKSNLSNSQS